MTPTPDPQSGSEPRLRLRQQDVAARGFQDETVILDLRSSTYFSTNATGTVLWRELERGTTRAQLIGALLNEFEVDEERATADVDAFVADCRQRGLLAEDPPPA